MPRIALASFLVFMALLGLVFGLGMLALSRLALPTVPLMGASAVFALAVVLVQFFLGPKIIDFVMLISWTRPVAVSPEFDRWMSATCAQFRIPVPQFGIIEDVGPNAFTYGNFPSNARVVVTRGVIDCLTEEELKAVVAHELGHIRNRDFIFMTLVQALVLLAYVAYRATRASFNKNSLWTVPLSYAVYQLSYYISLLLSRLREYMADYASAQIMQTGNPLASALVKISYGLADTSKTANRAGSAPIPVPAPATPYPANGRQPIQPIVQNPNASIYDYSAPLPDVSSVGGHDRLTPDVMAKVNQMQAKHNQEEIAPLMGLLGMKPQPQLAPTAAGNAKASAKNTKLTARNLGAFGVAGQSGVLAAVAWFNGNGGIDTGNFTHAARWELFNPWAKIAELVSTHPLTARRIQALMKLNSNWGVKSDFDFSKVQPGRYPRFILDVLIFALPWAGAAAGGALGYFVHSGSPVLSSLGGTIAGAAALNVLKLILTYPFDFTKARVVGLLGELNVSHINPRRAILEGRFTGHVDAGFAWSHNFVLQDETGFVPTVYRQPFGIEFLLALLGLNRNAGRPVQVTGWYRRFGHPYLEIASIKFLDTGEVKRCHYLTWMYVLTFLALLGGFGLMILAKSVG